MGLSRPFLKPRVSIGTRPVEERVSDYGDVYVPLSVTQLKQQASRCMDCGTPFCQAGCPLGNIIPDWNNLVSEDDWRQAYRRLAATNNFPEFTGRVCPAPCESACVLGIIGEPVTIEQIERAVVERAFESGWVTPRVAAVRTGKSVAVIGSGPAGLACADQLSAAGHDVTVFERDDRIGGLLRYGIPDFKLEKWVIDRRMAVMEDSGVRFEVNAEIGGNIPVSAVQSFDAVVLATGSIRPRDLPIPGRELAGVHFAWDYLTQQNKINAGDRPPPERITAQDKDIIVIGGGDTGSDCVGTANRQRAATITQFEVMPTPSDSRPESQPWPYMPTVFTATTSHKEGADRHWSILTKRFEGEGRVQRLVTADVAVSTAADGRLAFDEIPGSERSWPADLVVLAIGYAGPDRLVADALGVDLDARGNIQTDGNYGTPVEGIFAAGDGRRGQSLIVWAISEGREAAKAVDSFLTGASSLPTKGAGDLPRRMAVL